MNKHSGAKSRPCFTVLYVNGTITVNGEEEAGIKGQSSATFFPHLLYSHYTSTLYHSTLKIDYPVLIYDPIPFFTTSRPPSIGSNLQHNIMDTCASTMQTILKAINSSTTGLRATLYFAYKEGVQAASCPVFLWSFLASILAGFIWIIYR